MGNKNMFTTIDIAIAGTLCFVLGSWFGTFLAAVFTIAGEE